MDCITWTLILCTFFLINNVHTRLGTRDSSLFNVSLKYFGFKCIERLGKIFQNYSLIKRNHTATWVNNTLRNTVGSLPAKCVTLWYVWLRGKSPHNLQWRIQDFPWGGMDLIGGAWTPKAATFSENLYVKMKELGLLGGAHAGCAPLDLPMTCIAFVGCLLNLIVFELDYKLHCWCKMHIM